ncbi:reverse transcriptase domain-containing protein [Streptomyces anulatus]
MQPLHQRHRCPHRPPRCAAQGRAPSRHAKIDADAVRTFLDAADAADAGHRRLYFLTEAAAEANKRGLPDLRARAEMALQQTRPEWTSIRTEGTIPPALIAGQQGLIDAAPDLRTALWRTVRDIHPAMHAQAELEADGALEGLLRIPRSRINPAVPVFVRPPADADDDLAVEHYAFDRWLTRTYPGIQFEQYADDAVVHCVSEHQAREVLEALENRMEEVGLRLHPDKTRIVYCKDGKRRGSHEYTSFTFRSARNRKLQVNFTSFLPGISKDALKKISRDMA